MSPTLKYDNTGIEDMPDQVQAPVGTYLAVIKTAELKQSKNGNDMVELMMVLSHDASGTKLKEDYAPIWYYPIWGHDHPFVQNRWKEFIEAVGLKPKGNLDPDKLVGKKVQLKLKSDTDQDGDYRPSVKNMMAVATAPPLELSLSTEEPEEEEEPAAESEEEVSLDDAIADLDRDGLKQFIKENELGKLADLGINKATTDDQIREIIVNAWPDEEEEAEAEPEEEPEAEAEEEPEAEAESADNYDSLSIKDLKGEVAERELVTDELKAALKGKAAKEAKPILIAALREDDGTEPF